MKRKNVREGSVAKGSQEMWLQFVCGYVCVCVRVFVLGIIAHGLVISDYASA